MAWLRGVRGSVVAVSCLVVSFFGCTTSNGVGSWRADGRAAIESSDAAENFVPPTPTNFHKGYYSYSRSDEILGCMGAAAVVGGAGAIIYLQRFQGRGGGGGDVASPADLLKRKQQTFSPTARKGSEDELSPCGSPCEAPLL